LFYSWNDFRHIELKCIDWLVLLIFWMIINHQMYNYEKEKKIPENWSICDQCTTDTEWEKIHTFVCTRILFLFCLFIIIFFFFVFFLPHHFPYHESAYMIRMNGCLDDWWELNTKSNDSRITIDILWSS
jgi:quinol-cytochrome oxidoreductase complex cytochrome b subunit